MIPYEVITRFEDLGKIAEQVASAPIIGIDIECYRYTGGPCFDPRKGGIRLVQLAIGERIYVVDLLQTKSLGPLLDAMRSTRAIWVIHNAKFEQKWFWHHYQLEFWPIFDTYRASAMLYNGLLVEPLQKKTERDKIASAEYQTEFWEDDTPEEVTDKKQTAHDLNSVIIRELGEHPNPDDKGGSDWSKPLTQAQLDYAAEDVYRLLRLREVLRRKLVENGLIQAALIEFGVVLPEATVELNGFHVDRDRWKTLAVENEQKAKLLREELVRELPHPRGFLSLPGIDAGWNIDSTDQIKASLRRLGVPLDSTDRITLMMAASKHPLIDKVLEYRKYSKRSQAFGTEWLEFVNEDERVRASYFAMLASSRYSCYSPNLQQVPRDYEYRRCFTAPPGKVIIAADYATIEMRICAEISGDTRLIQTFQEDRDVHIATAARISGKSESDISKQERQMAKALNFGAIFGIKADKLVLYAYANYRVPMERRDAEKFLNKFFSKETGYSGIAAWHKRALRDGKRTRTSRSLSGRLRHLGPDAHNEFLNNPVQSTNADALKRSMRTLHDRLQKGGYAAVARPVHHVHDELLLEVDDREDAIQAVRHELSEAMREGMSPFLTRVPIVVEASHGESWGDAK